MKLDEIKIILESLRTDIYEGYSRDSIIDKLNKAIDALQGLIDYE